MKNTTSLAQIRTWQTGLLQTSVHRHTKKLADECLHKYGLTTMHWLILGMTLDSGCEGIRVTDLAKRAGTTVSYMTTALNRLEDQHMVSRLEDAADNRSRRMVIPEDYRQTCLDIEEDLRETFRLHIYNKISRKQLENYITVLQILADDGQDS